MHSVCARAHRCTHAEASERQDELSSAKKKKKKEATLEQSRHKLPSAEGMKNVMKNIMKCQKQGGFLWGQVCRRLGLRAGPLTLLTLGTETGDDDDD